MTKLFENEMDQAELVLAAKAVLGDMQKMIEKLARAETEGILPLLDGIRFQFGPTYADDLNNTATVALRHAMDAIQEAKNQISETVSKMEQIVTGEGPSNDMANNVGVPDDVETDDASTTGEETEGEESTTADDIADLFAADEPQVGRETKESVISQNIAMLRESSDPDRLLITETLKRFKRGASIMESIEKTAEQFAVDAEDIIELVKVFHKK